MNFEKLASYVSKKAEIEALKINIDELSSVMPDSPIIDKMKNQLSKAEKDVCEIVSFIADCEDSDVKSIMTYCFIKGYSYEIIGEMLHMDRRTVSRRLHAYIDKNAHNAHLNCDIIEIVGTE